MIVSYRSTAPAAFDGAEMVGDYAVLRWQTGFGCVGVAYPLFAGNGNVLWLVDELYRARGDVAHLSFASVVVVQTYWLVGPELHAVDLGRGGRQSALYKPTWAQLAGVIGADVPWWHSALRDRQTILDWTPGDPPAVVPAEPAELRIAPLLLLAADEPDGSAVGELCLWLARQIRHDATEAAIDYIAHVEEERGRGCRGMAVAAIPAPRRRDEPVEPSEMVQRAGWAEIVERRDSVAYAVADLAQSWDGGEHWPIGDSTDLSPSDCDLAARFVERLEPVIVGGEASTVMERWMVRSHTHQTEVAELFTDPDSGLPVVCIAKIHDPTQTRMVAAAPQRIPTTASLQAVTFSHDTVWVHTDDGGLWLAPQIAGHGLSWGYQGGGPWTLALLLRDLLDDITAPAVDDTGGPPPDGLLELTTNAPQDEVSTFTRAHVEAARRS